MSLASSRTPQTFSTASGPRKSLPKRSRALSSCSLIVPDKRVSARLLDTDSGDSKAASSFGVSSRYCSNTVPFGTMMGCSKLGILVDQCHCEEPAGDAAITLYVTCTGRLNLSIEDSLTQSICF